MRGKTGKRACAQGCEGNEPRQFRVKFTGNPASGGSGCAVYAHCELRKQKILRYSLEFSKKKLRYAFDPNDRWQAAVHPHASCKMWTYTTPCGQAAGESLIIPFLITLGKPKGQPAC